MLWMATRRFWFSHHNHYDLWCLQEGQEFRFLLIYFPVTLILMQLWRETAKISKLIFLYLIYLLIVSISFVTGTVIDETSGFTVNPHLTFPFFSPQARVSDQDTDNRFIGQQIYVNIRVSLPARDRSHVPLQHSLASFHNLTWPLTCMHRRTTVATWWRELQRLYWRTSSSQRPRRGTRMLRMWHSFWHPWPRSWADV